MKIDRSSRGLSTALFNEFEALERGESTPQQARAKASIANTIISLSRLEMDFARFVADSRADSETKSLPSLNLAASPALASE